MKKILLIFAFISPALAGKNQVISDDARFSLRAGFGYNLPVATGVLATSNDNGATKGIYGSWGKGVIPAIDFSVKVYQGVHVVLGAGTLFGPAVKSSSLSSTETSSTDQSTSSKIWIPVLLTAGGRYEIHLYNDKGSKTGICHKFIPYVGFGLGIALGSRVKNSINSLQTTGSTSVNTETKSTTTFKPALDIYGELGVKYCLSKSFSVFLDARLSSLSLLPSKQKITSETINGKDVTSTLTTSQKETDFVRDVPSSAGGPDEPSRELALKEPASGLAISCGISWNFGFGGKVMPGGPGGSIPPGGFKPAAAGPTREKVKVAGAVKACEDCPATELELVSNNDDKDFPAENSKEAKSGPYGKSELLKVEILTHDAVCESCNGIEGNCCCRLKTLKVKLTFQITYDTAALNKGVWLNTNKDSKEYEHTRKGNSLPDRLANKEDWKKVDRKSVEVHERQHCSDIKDAAKNLILEALKKVTVDQCVCGENGGKTCKEKMDNLCVLLGRKLNEMLGNAMDKISASENENYTKGDLEKKAREVQAQELNNRPE